MVTNLSRLPRLYTTASLNDGEAAALLPEQAHYLSRVMRLSIGDSLKVFNGDDGEWLAEIEQLSKRGCIIRSVEKLREPQILPDLEYLFAPLKTARIDYLAQKATEMGVAHLRPVFTEYTQGRRLKLERLVANTIEAAEQCNLVAVPTVSEPQKLQTVLDNWPENENDSTGTTRQLIFCDEAAPSDSPLEIFARFAGQPLAVLIGPEGGFSQKERSQLLDLSFVTPVSLGPRIMRADTAAVAVLALLQASVGDWH